MISLEQRLGQVFVKFDINFWFTVTLSHIEADKVYLLWSFKKGPIKTPDTVFRFVNRQKNIQLINASINSMANNLWSINDK